jgi:hypothetical protein
MSTEAKLLDLLLCVERMHDDLTRRRVRHGRANFRVAVELVGELLRDARRGRR